MKKEKKLPFVEIILMIMFVILTAVFFMLQDRIKDGGTVNGQNTSGSGGVYDKYNELVQADAEDEETYKKMYLFMQNINKETYFKYQVKHIGEEVTYYKSVKKLGKSSKESVISGTHKLTVTGVEVLDSYKENDSEDCYVNLYHERYEELVNRKEGTEGYKFIRVTVNVYNTFDEAYVWEIYNDCALMGEDGRFIKAYERIAEEFPKDEEIQFYETLYLENSSIKVPVDSVSRDSSFLMEAGATHTFSQIFLVPEEAVTNENLVYGDWESVKGRDAAGYMNGGFRVYLNQ